MRSPRRAGSRPPVGALRGLGLGLPLGLLLLALAGCPAAGDLCTDDGDCPGGMRCSARAENRGVCTYPEGVPDAAKADAGAEASVDALSDGPRADLRDQADGAPREAAPDAPREAAADTAADLPTLADQRPPDGPAADGPPQDGSLPDAAQDAGGS